MKQLFKYMREPRDFFEEGFIRLSQPSVLNDPFEASFCKKSLDELASYFDNTTSWDLEYGELSFSDYVQLRIHHIGVISLTENKENLLMWAHYANEHKGVVAGIASFKEWSIFQNLFRGSYYISDTCSEAYSPFDGIPKPVSYRKGLRYRNDKFDYDYSNISVEGADRILYEVFLQKSDEWIYEQEHRVILRLEQADRVVIPNLNLISNETIVKRIKEFPFACKDSKGGYIIDLYKCTDEFIRMGLAMPLAKLSTNPQVIYLMKLNSSAINNCLLGLKCNLSKHDILVTHATKTGYLDVWKAKKNLDYYSIEFEEI